MGIFYSFFYKNYNLLGVLHGDPEYGRLPGGNLDWECLRGEQQDSAYSTSLPISLWNNHDNILEGKETTNNHVEGMSFP